MIYNAAMCYYPPMVTHTAYSGAIVLGMHDALVSQTGIIAGLTFALADTKLIIMTGVISAVADGLSMMASNYLAERERAPLRTAIMAGVYTGIAYLRTSTLLIIPFFITDNARRAIMGDTRNLVIASLILTLGIGGAELTFGDFTIGGIGLAALVGVILNLIIPKSKAK